MMVCFRICRDFVSCFVHDAVDRQRDGICRRYPKLADARQPEPAPALIPGQPIRFLVERNILCRNNTLAVHHKIDIVSYYVTICSYYFIVT